LLLIKKKKRELIIQTLNSSKTRTNENTTILYDLSKLLIEKQHELTNLLKIGIISINFNVNPGQFFGLFTEL